VLKHDLPVLALVLAVATTTGATAGETTPNGYGPKSEEERAIAEQIKVEDERDQKTHGDVQLVSLEGKLYLENAASLDTAPWILGHFAADKRAYRVILEETGIYPDLKASNGKRIRLSGKVRLSGKYLVVTRIQRPVRVPVGRPKRGGM